ncbi:MAG TPA: hypothetical protein VGK73_10645 [Polyangiaceae bacterium]
MKLRRPWRSATLAVALTLGSTAVRASPEVAHEHYLRAIALFDAGDLRAAKREFELAFTESPHPIVLYNLARVCLDLGELEAARSYGERFLAAAGPDAPEQQRADIQRMLEDLAPGAQRRPADSLRPVPSPDSLIAPAAAPRPDPPAAQSGAKPTLACAGCIPAAGVDELLAADRQRTAGIVLGATGTALLIAGVSVLVWNGAQARDAEAKLDALERAAPPGEVSNQEELAEILAYERAFSETTAELDATSQFKIAGWSMVGVGAALLGTGAVLVLTRKGTPPATLSLRGAGVSLSGHF